MPTAKPTQIIVHRIELQSSERKYLEEYLTRQQDPKNIAIRMVENNLGLIALAGAGGLAIHYGAKVWSDIQEALMSVSPSAMYEDLKKTRWNLANSISTSKQKKQWVDAGKPTFFDADGNEQPVLQPLEETTLGELYDIAFREFWNL